MRKAFLFFSLILLIFAFWLTKPQSETLAYDPSPYGMNTESGSPFWKIHHEIRHQPRLAVLLRETGVKWMRIWVHWSLAEPQEDQWDEAHLQKVKSLLQAFQNEEINISLVLTKIPAWASSAPPGIDSDTYPPSDLKEYDEFVQEMVNRFGTLVQAWEIENEVSGKDGFTKPENRKIYTEMVKRAAQIIKRKNPKSIILPSSFVPYEPNRGVIVYWLKQTAPYVDVLNVHKYGTNEIVIEAIRRFKNYANEAGVGSKPIWLTETNVCSPCPCCPAPCSEPYPEEAKRCMNPPDGGEKLRSRFRAALNEGVEKVFWFHMTTRIWGPGILEPPKETASGQYEPLEPMYSAYREMATGRKTISLSSGWNEITWPDISGYTAKSALEDIDNDCGAGVALAVVRKRKDWWENYVRNYGGRDFSLQNNQTYYIKVSKDCTWNP